MKKTITLIAALLLCLSAFAQQALFGGPQIVSPQVNPDNTVTFRYAAPKAIRVQITGDFLPTAPMKTPYGTYDAPGVVDLTEGEKGVWEFTSDTLAPELYMYSFIVDGLRVKDPANVYMIRDVSSVTNVFLVSAGEGDKGWLYGVHDVPHGIVSRVWYDSPVIGKQRRMTVYTPAGYENNLKKKYPVLYVLHGVGGDEEAWISLGRAAQIMDNLVAEGKAEPMIMVMTNGNPAMQAAPGEGPEGLTVPTMGLPHTMDGLFEQSFPDVVKYVESHYRAIPKKSARAICGLSMGGFHSLHISCHYPDMFDYVGLFSAAIMPGQRNDGTPVPEIYDDLDGQLKAQFSKNPKLYWIGIGNADFLYQANVDYRRKLDEAGYKYTYFETGKGHIWENWRIYLSEFVPLIFR